MRLMYTLLAHKGNPNGDRVLYTGRRYGWCKRKGKKLRRQGYSTTSVTLTQWGEIRILPGVTGTKSIKEGT